MTAVEKIIAEINNELQTLESLHGSEIMGRKIGLTFAKRIAEQAKAMEKEQIKNERVEAYNNGYANGQIDAYAN
jgi:hypothetical protein